LTTGDTVAVIVGNHCEFFELAMACAHGGWTYVPVNWHWVADELAYVFADADAKAVFDLASAYFSAGQSNQAVDALEVLLTNSSTRPEVFLSLVDGYRQLGRVDKVETALTRYTAAEPTRPEGWYDLAAVQIASGRKDSGSEALMKALALSDARLAQDPKATDLRKQAARDPRLKNVSLPK